jgi:hypothetical protein
MGSPKVTWSKACKLLIFGAWRSLVAHLVWDQGVASSNLAAPTYFFRFSTYRFLLLFHPQFLPPGFAICTNGVGWRFYAYGN